MFKCEAVRVVDYFSRPYHLGSSRDFPRDVGIHFLHVAPYVGSRALTLADDKGPFPSLPRLGTFYAGFVLPLGYNLVTTLGDFAAYGTRTRHNEPCVLAVPYAKFLHDGQETRLVYRAGRITQLRRFSC